jgi:HK97 gp10 family phage protein
MPSVVYSLVVRNPGYLLVGSGDLVQDTFQIDGIATDPDSATSVSLAVHGCLSGVSGSFSGSTVRGIFRINGRDLFDSETQLHRSSSDYTVWYKEAWLKVVIEGLAELEESLRELPKATSTNVLKRALTNAADPIEQDAKRLAPVLSGKLQRSVKTGGKLSKRQRAANPKKSQVEIYVGPGALREAVVQEFGTFKMRPQPFLRPAWSSNWRKSLDMIRDELAAEIEKARQRLARKAERLARMMK